MKIVNCTTHVITFLSDKNVLQTEKKQFVADPSQIEVIAHYDPSGYLPRVNMSDECIDHLDNIPVHQVQYGVIENLPEPQENTCYVVSRIVAEAASKLGRSDVYAPGAMVRDINDLNVVLGCLFLQKQ